MRMRCPFWEPHRVKPAFVCSPLHPQVHPRVCRLAAWLVDRDTVEAEGDVGQVRALLEDTLALRRAQALKGGIAHALICLGQVVAAQGEASLAQSLLEAGLALHQELYNQPDNALTITGSGALSAAKEQWEQAARLLASSEALRAHPNKEPEEEVFRGRLVAAAIAWAEGRVLTLEQVVSEAYMVMGLHQI
jgi:hypothetical protein